MTEAEKQELNEALIELRESWSELTELAFRKEVLILALTPIIVIGICIFFFSYRRLYKKHIIKQSKKAAKIDMKGWVKWYRELPAAYSPAIVSLLCDYHHELHKDLPGVILHLCVNGYIDIFDNGKDVLFYDKGKDVSNLSRHERYVFDYILNKTDKFDNKVFLDFVMYDAQKLELILDKNSSKYKNMSGWQIWARSMERFMKYAIPIIPIVGFIAAFSIPFSLEPSLGWGFLCVFFGIIGAFGSLFVYKVILEPIFALFLIRFSAKEKVKSEFDYLRTEKGNLDYKNWISFKQFLEDFSVIHTRDFNEIYLWEYYLAYAASLGVSNQLLKTADTRIINNNKFKILNYDKFIASIDKRKKSF